MKRIFALLCAIALPLPLFSCGNKQQGDGSGMMYNASLLNNPQSLDPQFAEDESSCTVITNLYSGLMQSDSDGNITCRNAASYTISDDCTIYTFKLREDNYWFFDTNDNDKVEEEECFPVTADDYVFTFRRLLNPEMQSPYGSDFICIKGGASALSGAASPDSIGVYAQDDTTLVIELEYPCADFLNLLTTNAAVPCNEEFFLSTKGRYGLDDNSVMSNGAFFVRQWFYDPYGKNNILYMKRNAANSSEENKVYPSYLSFTIERSAGDIKEMFKKGKIDCFTTLDKDSFNKKKYEITAERSITLGLVFNPQDRICANLNFRKALAYSINRSSLQEQINDDVQAAYGIIPPAVDMLGRSYRSIAADSAFSVYDESKAVSACTAAKRELNAESFGTLKMLVATDTLDSGYVHILTRHWQDVLGFYISVDEVTSAQFESRMAAGDYQIALYPLSGTYNSGISVLSQLSDCGFVTLSGTSKAAVSSLKSCPELSGLAAALSSAEEQILSEFSFIPVFYKNSYLICTSENEDILLNPFSGGVDFRIAKYFG